MSLSIETNKWHEFESNFKSRLIPKAVATYLNSTPSDFFNERASAFLTLAKTANETLVSIEQGNKFLCLLHILW